MSTLSSERLRNKITNIPMKALEKTPNVHHTSLPIPSDVYSTAILFKLFDHAHKIISILY